MNEYLEYIIDAEIEEEDALICQIPEWVDK
jgi:hypothetical protein